VGDGTGSRLGREGYGEGKRMNGERMYFVEDWLNCDLPFSLNLGWGFR
jgi:hypothetical protein